MWALGKHGEEGVSFASHGNIWEWLQIPWFCGLPPTCCPDRDTLILAAVPPHRRQDTPATWLLGQRSPRGGQWPQSQDQHHLLKSNKLGVSVGTAVWGRGTSLSNHSTLLRVGPIEGSSPQRCASRVAKPSSEGGIDSGEPPHSVGRPAFPLPLPPRCCQHPPNLRRAGGLAPVEDSFLGNYHPPPAPSAHLTCISTGPKAQVTWHSPVALTWC